MRSQYQKTAYRRDAREFQVIVVCYLLDKRVASGNERTNARAEAHHYL